MSSVAKRLRHAWEQIGMIHGFEDGLPDLSCMLDVAKLRWKDTSFSQSRSHVATSGVRRGTQVGLLPYR
jgi:hypothetical protein